MKGRQVRQGSSLTRRGPHPCLGLAVLLSSCRLPGTKDRLGVVCTSLSVPSSLRPRSVLPFLGWLVHGGMPSKLLPLFVSVEKPVADEMPRGDGPCAHCRVCIQSQQAQELNPPPFLSASPILSFLSCACVRLIRTTTIRNPHSCKSSELPLVSGNVCRKWKECGENPTSARKDSRPLQFPFNTSTSLQQKTRLVHASLLPASNFGTPSLPCMRFLPCPEPHPEELKDRNLGFCPSLL